MSSDPPTRRMGRQASSRTLNWTRRRLFVAFAIALCRTRSATALSNAPVVCSAMGSMLTTPTPGTSREDYTQDGPLAQRIANVTPFFPFKGIERFYDIGGFMQDPEALRLVVEVLTNRYRDQELSSIGCIDARGFVLGPPIAMALDLPCFMLRKKGKMPNAVTGKAYSKEYAGDDSLSIPRGAVKQGDRVLLIDDLVATGGTLAAAVELVHMMGGVVVECACAVELKFLNASKKFEEKGFGHVPIWALMSEDIMHLDGLADPNIPSDGYVDDGEAH